MLTFVLEKSSSSLADIGRFKDLLWKKIFGLLQISKGCILQQQTFKGLEFLKNLVRIPNTLWLKPKPILNANIKQMNDYYLQNVYFNLVTVCIRMMILWRKDFCGQMSISFKLQDTYI